MGLQGKNLVSGLNGVNREEGDELRKKMSFTNPEEDDEFQDPGFRKVCDNGWEGTHLKIGVKVGEKVNRK
jgi:hypothetical protein